MTIYNVIIELASASFSILLTFLFFSAFGEKRISKVLHGIVFLFADVIFVFSRLYLESFLNLAVLVLLTFSISLVYRIKFLSKAIFTLLYLSLCVICEAVIGVLVSLMFSIDMKMGKTGVYYVMGLLLSKFVVFLIISFIRIKKRQIGLLSIKRNYIPAILIPASTLAVMLLQYKYFLLIPSNDKSILISVAISYSLLIASNILVFYFMESLYKNYVNENKISISEKIIETQKIQYKNLLENHYQIAKIQHDNKNKTIGLISMLEKGNVQEALSSLKKEYDFYKSFANRPEDIFYTIVKIKNEEASKLNAEIIIDERNMSKLIINSIDIAIILGNALDNAIEAVARLSLEEKKIINVYAEIINESVIVLIKNKVTGKVEIGNMQTSKKDKEKHGFGIESIKYTISKYKGEISFSQEENIFTTHIIMQNISLN